LTIKVCISLPPKTVDEAFSLIGKAEAQYADLIEIRLDSLKKHDKLADIASTSNTPLIATNKSTKNHGNYSGSEKDRQKILLNAASKGFEYVDVELSTPNITELIGNLREAGAKPTVSFHDFNHTPAMLHLNRVFEQEIEAGAYVCKIVTTAKRIEDNLTLLDFVSKASKRAKIVCFAMGELGKTSRLLSPVFGAFFTFASLDKKMKTADGQLTIQEMKQAYAALGLEVA
jgi:3-dehydroquinate dehydratase type I